MATRQEKIDAANTRLIITVGLCEAEIQEATKKINRALHRHAEILASIYAKYEREMVQAIRDEVEG